MGPADASPRKMGHGRPTRSPKAPRPPFTKKPIPGSRVSTIMRTTRTLTLILAVSLGAAPLAPAESANHYLADPGKYEGKQVKLDVRVVRPVPWTSPIEAIRFFHAFTEDKKRNALAGVILVAVPASEVDRFTDEYSMSATRRSETLRGVFRSMPTRSTRKPRVYLIDYQGRCADILAKHQGVAIEAETPER